MPKKKSAKTRLPRTIAGIRINNELRRAVEPILRFAGHPLVSDILAATLVASAESLMKDKGRDKSSKSDAAGKERPIGLLMAVAAGEIASHIAAAYGAAPEGGNRPAKSRQKRAPGAKQPARAKRELAPAGTPGKPGRGK